MPNEKAINALLVTQAQLADAAGAVKEAKAMVDAALAELRAESPATVTIDDGDADDPDA